MMTESKFKFQPGKPACPVACKYCFITEHEIRREVWNKKPLLGINKACTFVNVPPWINEDKKAQEDFYNFPFHLLEGDIVGFTAISDPLWPLLEEYFDHFVKQVSPIAKLVTAVTKWPLSEKTVKKLAKIPNFALVVSITGNNNIEKIHSDKHLKTLELCKKHGVKALPICHPYISGVSDLSFLAKLKELGYDFMDVKGFRYCHKNMSDWMPKESLEYYQNNESEEILPEDGWKEEVIKHGFDLKSPKKWYLELIANSDKKVDKKTANEQIEQLLELGNIVTSSSNKEVINSMLNRKM